MSKSHIRLVYSSPPGSFTIQSDRPEPYYEHGGGNGGGDNMLERVRELEKDIQQMKINVEVMRSNYATKSDVSEAKTSIISWVVGAVVLSQLIPSIPNILKVFFH